MGVNQNGYTTIEFLSVLAILTVIALLISPIILNIIEDSEEKTRIDAIEEYVDSIDDAVKIYIEEHPQDTIDDNLICSKTCNDKCVIDATLSGKDGEISKKCENATKTIEYYKRQHVVCESVIYNRLNSIVEVKGCIIDNDTSKTYSGDSKNGVTLDKKEKE